MKTLVVILNKDNAEGLRRCIDSLLNQTAEVCKDFDILVLDGASSDNSEEVVKSYSCYPCIQFKVQDRLGGTGYARVEACEYAVDRGYDAVIWGDSENIYFPDYVEKMINGVKSSDAAGGLPVVKGDFFAHAFAWYHAIHALIPKLSEMHIPGNNKAERVEIFKNIKYPETRRAEDYGFSLSLRKKGIKLRHSLTDAKVLVSVPESWSEVHRWQMARAIGAAEAAYKVKAFPYDLLIWMLPLIPFPLALFLPLLSLCLFILLFVVSTAIFIKSEKYLESPRKRYFFAPFIGIMIHSFYNLISLFKYLRLRIL